MNLASIQKIIDIKPIEEANAVELAFVLGWQVVVKKGEFEIGDFCCYIQIDTIAPEKEYFEFLRERNFKIRTIKLRKQLSQGLIVSLDSLPEFKTQYAKTIGYYFNEGEDVTELIGIKKYEKIDNNPKLYEKPRKPKIWYKKWVYLFKYNILYKIFPNLLPKTRSDFPKNLVSITDEERIQNIPQVLEKYKNKEFAVSYKLDGSSITIIHQKVLSKSKFRICSRRFELHNNKNDWYKVFKDTNFENYILKLVNFYKTNDVIIQGEAIGKFNGNHHNLPQDDIRVFNIYVNGVRLKQNEVLDVCKQWNIPVCPLYKTIVLNHSMDEILKISEIPDVLNPKVPVEGLVWRCLEDNFSFKVINNQYLLKER
jgi:hypothetical protein